jgi:hypothetical protein
MINRLASWRVYKLPRSASFLSNSMPGIAMPRSRVWLSMRRFTGTALPSAWVAQAESFARTRGARGIYVDTPTTNDRIFFIVQQF